MKKWMLTTWLVQALAGMTLAHAADPQAPQDPLNLTAANFLEVDAMVLPSMGRPNEQARWRGLKSYTQGRYPEAADAFLRGAHYADKFSQHYLSLMYWHGIGVERDPVQAYVWADLAAERMGHGVLLVREKMWQQLSPAQREQVLERGPALYERYGDAVAQPRTEAAMRQFARDMTGSRVGWRGNRLSVSPPPSEGKWERSGVLLNKPFSADNLYGPDGGLRLLTTYWQTQDVLLDGGRVEVGQPLATPR